MDKAVLTAGDDGVINLWNVLDIKRACEIGRSGSYDLRRVQYLGADRVLSAC